VLLRDLDDDMDKSIRVLLDRGWKLKFTGGLVYRFSLFIDYFI